MSSQGWRDRALCNVRRVSLKVFFPPRYDDESTAVARAWCAACPVAGACLEMAMVEEKAGVTADRLGVFGGLSPSERAALYRRRRKQEGQGAR